MVEGADVHNFESRLETVLKRIRSSKEISDDNKIQIIRFHDHCFSEGLSPARVVKYTDMLYRLAKLLGRNFFSARETDVRKLVQKIERTELSEWTKHDYKVTLKRFYLWLRGREDYPKEVKWIKTTVKDSDHKLPEELLTEEEIMKMTESVDHPRDKALILTLYESGARIGELLSRKLKHVELDQYGAQMMLSGKKRMRRVRLWLSCPYLVSWINIHPLKDNPDSPLWTELGRRKKEEKDKIIYERKQIGYRAVVKVLQRAAQKAGVKKRIHPHLFRHSRATYLAKHLTEAQMKEVFGWTQGSEMASIYVHLSGRDVDDALLKVYGVKKDEDKKDESILKPKECPRCGSVNAKTAKFCSKCSLVLDIETALKVDKKISDLNQITFALIERPKVKKVLAQELAETGLGEKLKEILDGI
jgi:integrase/recombinase XerD